MIINFLLAACAGMSKVTVTHMHASHWIVEHDILSSQFQQHGIIKELGYAHIL